MDLNLHLNMPAHNEENEENEENEKIMKTYPKKCLTSENDINR